MADGSTIEWLAMPGTKPASWNPVRARNRETGKVGWHCEHASPGCGVPGPQGGGCYSEAFNRRLGTGLPFKPGHREDIDIYLDEAMLLQPLRWTAPRSIFVHSMTDTFASFVEEAWLDRIFAVMALCPQHWFFVLTKRADRMREYLTKPHSPGKAITILDDGSRIDTPSASVRAHDAMCDLFGKVPPQALNAAAKWQDEHHPGGDGFIRRWPLPNVLLGVSAEDQRRADERIPDLLATPAAVRWVSAEPLIGPVDFSAITMPVKGGPPYSYCALRGAVHPWLEGRSLDDTRDPANPRLDWVVCGGESGPNARPFVLGWGKDIVRQCQAAGVPVFMKQLGARPTNREGEPHPARDRKGGDPAEWPEELRVRQMPDQRLDAEAHHAR